MSENDVKELPKASSEVPDKDEYLMNPYPVLLANSACWDCIGEVSLPTFERRVRDCPVSNCTCHPLRPYQK